MLGDDLGLVMLTVKNESYKELSFLVFIKGSLRKIIKRWIM